MLNPIYFYGAFILVILVGIAIVVAVRTKSSVEVRERGPIPLREKRTLLTSDKFASVDAANVYLKGGAGTFSCFIYLDNMARTGSAVDCGTRPNQPSCATGLFDPCKCTSQIDCTNCAHVGYKTLFSLYGVYRFEILNVPDASRPNSVSAQLVVQTETMGVSGRESYLETLSLPTLPLQKWIMITIGKEGRRVDVYYNDRIVSSSKMLHMIATMSPTGTICEGGADGLSGVIAVMRMSEFAKPVPVVAAEYTSLTDTRGRPLDIADDLDAYGTTKRGMDTSEIVHNLCLDGSCLSLPRFPSPGPEGPLYDLTSPYA